MINPINYAEVLNQAQAMISAADGYADDENVRFAGDIWSAGNLREQADDLIEQFAIELGEIAHIKRFLIDHYENGAHWVLETTSDAEFLEGLRQHGGDVEAYKADLRRHWEVLHAYAEDIRNA